MTHERKNQVRLRIAPSPTGYPHIGTIYQALFNYAYAKKYTGTFIVRIEDTDQARFVEGAEEFIFNSLDWVGLTEQESPRKEGSFGPYRQSERLPLYHKYAEELIAKGNAYFSYFPKKDAGQKKDYSEGRKENTASETEQTAPSSIKEMIERGDWVVRLRVPTDGVITIKDEIRGEIVFPVKEVTDQVLIKSDGFPTYHLAVVVDDHLMEISHIVRAEEWLPSTPKHVLLYSYFGWEIPPLYHTATLRNPDKSKLSKRHGHTNVLWYKDEGYLPEAILNYLALLGWSHPEEKEIFTLEEFVDLFDLKDVRPVAPIFDLTKLTWMNQQYIQTLTEEKLYEKLLDFDPSLKEKDEMTLKALLPLLLTRMQTLKDAAVLTDHFFHEPELVHTSEQDNVVARDLVAAFQDVTTWEKDSIFQACKSVMVKHGIRMPLLYKLLTGAERGLPLPESLEILGKEKVLTRLKLA